MLHRTTPKLDPALTGSARTVALFLAELRHNPPQRAHAWSIAAMADRCGLGVTQFVTVVDTTAPALAGVPADETNECDNVSAPAVDRKSVV